MEKYKSEVQKQMASMNQWLEQSRTRTIAGDVVGEEPPIQMLMDTHCVLCSHGYEYVVLTRFNLLFFDLNIKQHNFLFRCR